MGQHDGDDARCLQNIAEAFQAEPIATTNVTKQDESYFLAISNINGGRRSLNFLVSHQLTSLLVGSYECSRTMSAMESVKLDFDTII